MFNLAANRINNYIINNDVLNAIINAIVLVIIAFNVPIKINAENVKLTIF